MGVAVSILQLDSLLHVYNEEDVKLHMCKFKANEKWTS